MWKDQKDRCLHECLSLSSLCLDSRKAMVSGRCKRAIISAPCTLYRLLSYREHPISRYQSFRNQLKKPHEHGFRRVCHSCDPILLHLGGLSVNASLLSAYGPWGWRNFGETWGISLVDGHFLACSTAGLFRFMLHFALLLGLSGHLFSDHSPITTTEVRSHSLLVRVATAGTFSFTPGSSKGSAKKINLFFVSFQSRRCASTEYVFEKRVKQGFA